MSSTTQYATFSDLKECCRCSTQKPLDLFNRMTKSPDGRNAWCRECQNRYMAAYVRRKPTSAELRRTKYRKIHGITIAQYDALFAKQQGRCAICRTTTPGSNVKHFTVDHCHTTGRIRGLLCRPCNMALGLFKDAPLALVRAARYVGGCK